MALHMRLHEFGTEVLARVGSHEPSPSMWGELLEEMVEQSWRGLPSPAMPSTTSAQAT
jgi:hypothetical protein